MHEIQMLHASALISLLHDAPHEAAMIEITGLAPRQTPIKRWFTRVDVAAEFALETNAQRYSTFVAVNPRKAFSGFEHDVPYVTALGLDVDDKKASVEEAAKRLALCGLHPTATVSTGHGAHFYLKLAEPSDCSKAKIVWERLCKFSGSDPIQNTNRVLRLPGTVNWKALPVWCFLTGMDAGRTYAVDQIDAALDRVGAAEAQPAAEGIPVPVEPPMSWIEVHKRLSPGVLDIIATGEKNAYSEKQITRSEADWVVVCALVSVGCSDQMIAWVYANFPVNLLKYREAGAHYLNQTIKAARRATAAPVENRVVASTRTASQRYTGGAADQQRSRYANRMYR